MSGLAALLPPPDAIPAKPDKPVRISKRLQQAIALLETGTCSTQRAAAERAGLSEFHLSRELKKPAIRAFMARKRQENIAVGAIRASRRFVELIDAKSEHVAAQVCERVLEESGDLRTPNGISINNNINLQAPGYVIRLRHHDEIVDVTPNSAVTHD